MVLLLMTTGKLSLITGKLSSKSPRSTTISTKGVFSRLGNSSQATTPKAGGMASRVKASLHKSDKGGTGDNAMSFTVTGLGKVDPQHIVNSMKTVRGHFTLE